MPRMGREYTFKRNGTVEILAYIYAITPMLGRSEIENADQAVLFIRPHERYDGIIPVL